MKVVKKVKLLTKDKDGNYVKNDTCEILRHRAVVQEILVAEYENNYKETGIVYIVDEAATNERNELKNPKVVKSVDKAPLQDEYEELTGNKPNGTWGVNKLTIEINKLKS